MPTIATRIADYCQAAQIALANGDLPAARQAERQAQAEARVFGHHSRIWASTLIIQAERLLAEERPGQAYEVLVSAVKIEQRHGAYDDQLRQIYELIGAATADPDEAIRFYQQAIHVAEVSWKPGARSAGTAHLALAHLAEDRGDIVTAIEQAEEGLATAIGFPGQEVMFHEFLARLFTMSNPLAAADHLAQVEKIRAISAPHAQAISIPVSIMNTADQEQAIIEDVTVADIDETVDETATEATTAEGEQ